MTPINQSHNPDDAAATQAPSLLDPRFDFKAMRLSQNFATGAAKKTIVQIPVRKPGPFWWFRVHPDPAFHYDTRMFEVKEDNELYMVTPELQQELGEILVSKILYPAITRQGVLFLWPVRLPDETGRLDSWNRSAMAAAETAMTKWTRIESNRQLGGYNISEPLAEIKDQPWPKLSIEEILTIGFKHSLIESLDHPRLRALRGE